jgi:hypothetical protein
VSTTDQAIDRIVQRAEGFSAVLEAIFRRQHTGTVLLHCVNGVPKLVEFPGIQVRLLQGDIDKSEKLIDPT